jgi:hypothetical protein
MGTDGKKVRQRMILKLGRTHRRNDSAGPGRRLCGQRKLFHGYYFKVLKGQGPAAHLGQLDYVIEGAMIGGFALVAVPAQYRVTGVMTFIVSYDGVVYQKDLGPDSLDIVKKMERYNPDKTWQPTDDEE